MTATTKVAVADPIADATVAATEVATDFTTFEVNSIAEATGLATKSGHSWALLVRVKIDCDSTDENVQEIISEQLAKASSLLAELATLITKLGMRTTIKLGVLTNIHDISIHGPINGADQFLPRITIISTFKDDDEQEDIYNGQDATSILVKMCGLSRKCIDYCLKYDLTYKQGKEQK